MKKVVLFGLIGLFSFTGCSKDEEEDITPASSSMTFNGEAVPFIMATSDGLEAVNSDMQYYRDFKFYSNAQYTLSVSVYYNNPEDFKPTVYNYNIHNATNEENQHSFLASLRYDANNDGSYSGADDFSLTTDGGTFELIEYNPESEKIAVKVDFLLQDGNTLKGTFSGYYVEDSGSF